MKIPVIGKFYTGGFALHIAETLVGLGHSMRRFEPGFRSGRIAAGSGTGCVRTRLVRMIGDRFVGKGVA
ncbi:MAG: hypothetical protein KKA32_19125 [Actinobacteria bacterium]|nr:hypothetical protein [Actinomycetota bacterium]